MRGLILFALCGSAAYGQVANARIFRVEELRTPPGFEVKVHATVPGARHMAFGPNGVLYVAARARNSVVAVPEAGRTVTVLTNVNGPHSLTFRDNELWVAMNDGVLKYREAVTEDLVIRGQGERIATVPSGGNHSTRTLGIGPDERLYVAIGSTCNFCNERDQRRAAMVRFNLDGSGETLFATGLRNTVGFAWHPLTGRLWGTDHGGDTLGDREPPEEINVIEGGRHYGWPDCVGSNRVVNASAWRGNGERCASAEKPEFEMDAHAAPLGISFYTGGEFPASYRMDAFVALHGSWNRTDPSGYKVIRVRASSGRATGSEDFLWGFFDAATRTRSGRPVHAIEGPDGAVYVSDDSNGNIYRVSYHGPRIHGGGIAKVAGNVYAMYGFRLQSEGGTVRVLANGLAAEVLYAGETQINFAIPETLTGDVTIRVENEKAADEQTIRVE